MIGLAGSLGRRSVAQVPDGVAPSQPKTIGIRPEMPTILFGETDQAERVAQAQAEAQVQGTSCYGDMTHSGALLPGNGENLTISMRNTAGRSPIPAGSAMFVGRGVESIVLFK